MKTQTIKEYGVSNRHHISNDDERILEELKILGFSLLKNVANHQQLEEARKRLDILNDKQSEEFGREKLAVIDELDMVRCPLAYDDFFVGLASNEPIRKIAEAFIGGMHILHLQNGIINKPGEAHHQSSWHRDLPYQDFVISKPLAMGALWCIDPFTSETGATWVLPFSHREALLPSLEYTEQHKIQIHAEPGDVLLFDSMLFHCAGYNRSEIIRRAINHVYVTPILKQQIDLPTLLKGKYSDEASLATLFGYTTPVPESVLAFRERRWQKSQTAKK
jgi:ectoine hydroxylase-related dioxygenase (phytanoyl-CoA dioxygenase family)